MNDTNKKHFVLVHGAWHGAWCWEKVTPLLVDMGHEAHTLDLPGLGNDPTPISEITLDSYVNAVKDVIVSVNEPVVLVGHSMGGLIITQTAERVSDRVRRWVTWRHFRPGTGNRCLITPWLTPSPTSRCITR